MFEPMGGASKGRKMAGHHRGNKRANKIPKSATYKVGKKRIPDHYTAMGPQRGGKTK